MDIVTEIVNLMGLSLVVAFVTGSTLGLYLAAVNDFIPVRSVRKSFITNAVIGASFFIPLAFQRMFDNSPNLGPVAWISLIVLWLTFSMSADATNWLLCNRRLPRG